VLIVFIKYSNSLTDAKLLTYDYMVRWISGAEFKAEFPFYEGDQLLVMNRHGVRIVFLQVGSIGVFNFLTLLINLVSGLVLVKVAATLVDVLALKLLPQRDIYKKYKYEMTADFSDIRDGKVQVEFKEDEPLLHHHK